MKKIFMFFLFFLGLTIAAYSAQKYKVELKDGSIIEAEVASLSEGVYTLNTASLGQIKIEESKIKGINAVAANDIVPTNSLTTSDTDMQSEVGRLKTKMMSNPEAMNNVAGLMADPQFQELLKDPEIVKAVNSGDMQTLMANPKFMSVLSNPKLKEIKYSLDENKQ